MQHERTTCKNRLKPLKKIKQINKDIARNFCKELLAQFKKHQTNKYKTSSNCFMNRQKIEQRLELEDSASPITASPADPEWDKPWAFEVEGNIDLRVLFLKVIFRSRNKYSTTLIFKIFSGQKTKLDHFQLEKSSGHKTNFDHFKNHTKNIFRPINSRPL